MTQTDKQAQCCERIYEDLGSHQCPRKARDGKSYCTQHGRIKDREAANKESVRQGRENYAKARSRRAAEEKACEGISTEALEAGVVADLLAACEQLLQECGISPNGNAYIPSLETIAQAQDALAKAKGD